MSIPLHRDDVTDEDTPSHVALGDPKSDCPPDPDGFAEAAAKFQTEDLHRLPDAQPLQGSLEEARRKVEDLLLDAGVTPPARTQNSTTVGDRVARGTERRHSQRLIPAALEARVAKRVLDLLGALAALILFGPLMVLIALALRLEGGPVLYSQSRIGRARKRFVCLKFRTMRPDAEDRLRLLLACNDAAQAEWRTHQKLANDPRVTPLGRLLRESSLDELPQLINVLRGEMSLVGPRPIVAPEILGYDADRAYYGSAAFDDYAACLHGITGLWQISGRHQTIYLDRVRLDRQYARTWSVWLDLKILWKTVGVVIRRSGR